MGLADAIGAAGNAAATTAGSFGLLEGAANKAGREIENFTNTLSSTLKEFANTKDVIKFERSLTSIQRNSAKTTKEIRQLEKAFSGISKGSTYSAQQLAKLTSEMSSNLTMATMSNKAWTGLLKTLSKQFPQSMGKVLAMTSQLSQSFPSMIKALKTGNAEVVKSASIWAASTMAIEGNWQAFDQILNTITPVDDKLRELNIQQEKNAAILENSQLAWAKMTVKVSQAAQWIDKFIAKNYELTKVLKGVALAAGVAGAAVGLMKVGKFALGAAGKTAAGAGGAAASSAGIWRSIPSRGIPVHVTNLGGLGGGGGGPLGGVGPGGKRTARGRAAAARRARAGRAAGGGSGMLKWGGRAAGALSLAYMGHSAYTGYQEGGGKGAGSKLFTGKTEKHSGGTFERYGKASGTGALQGAGVGAMIGSFVPVIGTAVGAAVGGALGGIFGGTTEYLKPDKKKKKKAEQSKEEAKINEEIKKRERDLLRTLKVEADVIKLKQIQLQISMRIKAAQKSVIEGELAMLNKMGAGWQVIMKSREALLKKEKEEMVLLRENVKIIEKMEGFTKKAAAAQAKIIQGRIDREKDPEKKKNLIVQKKAADALASGSTEKFKAAKVEAKANEAKKAQVIEGMGNENIKMKNSLKNEELGLEKRLYEAKLRTMKALYYDPVSQVKQQIKATGILIEQEKNLRAAKAGLAAEEQAAINKINSSDKTAGQKALATEKVRNKYTKQRKKIGAEIAENIADQAESVNYIRRTWMETFTKMSMGQDSGSYLMPGASQLSGMQTKGAAFRPWGPTNAGGGVGTYGGIHGGAFGPHQTAAGRKLSEGAAGSGMAASAGARKISDALSRFADGLADGINRKIREQNQGRNR